MIFGEGIDESQMLSNHHSPYIRCPAVRSKFALDHLLGPSVNASSYLLKKITGKEKGERMRNLYTPSAIPGHVINLKRMH